MTMPLASELSVLKCKCDFDCECDFGKVSDRPTWLFHDRTRSSTFLAVSERFTTVSGLKKVTNGRKRSQNSQKRIRTVQERSSKRPGTMKGTFEPVPSNALQRIVESVHGTVTFTFQN
jgi:hypothetical protein